MTNNVRQLRPVHRDEAPKGPVEPEPTALQRAVLERAREMREREHQARQRPWLQWIGSAVLAVVAFAIMYNVVDFVLRKMQQIAEVFYQQMATPSEPAPQEPAQLQPQPQTPDQPYFIELQKDEPQQSE
jgi:hypothetical protein